MDNGRWHGAQKYLVFLAMWALAILGATWLEDQPVFKKINFVVSDELSQRLKREDLGRVALIEVPRLSKKDIQAILSRAIPALVDGYNARVVGVDIDFSGGEFPDLAANFANWSKQNPGSARKVVWAVGYQVPTANKRAGTQNIWEAFCQDCSGVSCQARFRPNLVFGGNYNPQSYALAIPFPDVDSVNRSSARFVCHSDNEEPLDLFHFKLFKDYCAGGSNLVTCKALEQNSQAKNLIYIWDAPDPVNLCALVYCSTDSGGELGARLPDKGNPLTDKIVVLYSDIPGNDEHVTTEGLQKGAAIEVALVNNELRFGVAQTWSVEAAKWTIEFILSGVLALLFHWKYTESWAIAIAAGLFIAYLQLVPVIENWVPDFRDYVLAIILAFWIEVLLKSFWNSLHLETIWKKVKAKWKEPDKKDPLVSSGSDGQGDTTVDTSV